MTHKVHPKSYRLRDSADWDSRWFEKKNLPRSLKEDFLIREFLKKKIGKLGVAKIEIERFPGKLIIIISTARPGLLIGRGGGGVEVLKKEIENKILKEKTVFNEAKTGKKEIKIDIKEIKDPWTSAVLVAQWMVQQIERRTAYRRILKQTIEKVMAVKGNLGVRVAMAGRLDGVEIARREWLKKGRMPRQTIRAVIDYAQDEALCTYGLISVKVWIYKGEKFN